MEANSILGRNELFSAMNDGRPFKSYVKTILGKVAVVIWDNFQEEPTEVILTGDPRRRDASCIVDVWSEKEDVFFKRLNQRLFARSIIVPFERPEVAEPVEKSVAQLSDEELDVIVNKKYYGLLAKLNEITEVVVLFRLKDAAERNDKSQKIMSAIDARISELQTAEYAPVKPVVHQDFEYEEE